MTLLLIIFVAYMTPGLFVARNVYAKEVRAVNSSPVVLVPPKPPRPQLKLVEMLHVSGPASRRCQALDNKRVDASCNCQYRDEWIEIKNGWIDYNEWNDKYGHISNGVIKAPTVNNLKVYGAVPGWPLVFAANFIKGGANGIPNYAEIQRLQDELREIE